MFFQKAYSLVKRYKEALSILGSIGAVLLSIYTYVATNLWNLHDVEVYVRGNITNDDESNPIQVILVNKGKRTETILEATMAINRRLPNGNTETSTLQVNSVPVVLEESSAKSVELAATTEALSDLYTRVGVKPQDPGDEFELKYGVNISYISSKGKVDGQFIPIGSVTGSGGHLHNFEDFGFDTDAPTRLR